MTADSANNPRTPLGEADPECERCEGTGEARTQFGERGDCECVETSHAEAESRARAIRAVVAAQWRLGVMWIAQYEALAPLGCAFVAMFDPASPCEIVDGVA